MVSLNISGTISNTRSSVSSGYPNTEKQIKAECFYCFEVDTTMKNEARVLEITSHDHS